MSRIIFSREDRVECLQVAHERPDTGIYNAINDMAMVLLRGEMRFATTHGFQSEYPGDNMALYLGFKNMECLRPMTAVGSASLGLGNPRGRSIAQVLDPVVPGRYSRSHAWAFEWDWLAPEGDAPKGGLIAVSGDEKLGQIWWFVHTDGLYRSTDGGEHLAKVLEASGQAASASAAGRPSGRLSGQKDLLAFLHRLRSGVAILALFGATSSHADATPDKPAWCASNNQNPFDGPDAGISERTAADMIEPPPNMPAVVEWNVGKGRLGLRYRGEAASRGLRRFGRPPLEKSKHCSSWRHAGARRRMRPGMH